MRSKPVITIHRSAMKSSYTMIQNFILEDRSIRLDACGLLIYLLSLPPDWKISRPHLCKEFGVGDHRIKGLLGQLRKSGYVEFRQGRHTDTNRFKLQEYHVFDTPNIIRVPEAEMPVSGSSVDRETRLHTKNSNQITTDSSNISQDRSSPGSDWHIEEWARFQLHWKLAPTDSFQSASKTWFKLEEFEQKLAIQYASGYQTACRNHSNPTGVRRYLVEKRWQGQMPRMETQILQRSEQEFIPCGSPEWLAWEKHRGRPFPVSKHLFKGQRGWWTDQQIPVGETPISREFEN